MKVKNVFLIEDDKFFATAFSKKLSEMGNFSIDHFTSVEIAIEKMIHLSPQIIFLDHHLEGMEGVDSIPKIKNILPKCEIVVVSAQRNPEVLEQAFDTGATKYFSKNALLMERTKDFIEEVKGKPSSFGDFWTSFLDSYKGSIPEIS